MRSLLLCAAALVLPVAIPAQGEIIAPCPDVRCAPGRPCAPCFPEGAVQRLRSDVRATLNERVVSYEINEVFVNRGSALGEADYMLPLPRHAAFRDLRLYINGEPIAGEVLGAEQARAIYEDIVRRQRDPALVEWLGHGLLRARIFPIAPGERKQVTVRYDAIPEREGDALRVDHFRGGRTVSQRPRMLPAGDDGTQLLSSESFLLRYPKTLGRAWSPTHQVVVRDTGNMRVAVVRGAGSSITLLLPIPRESATALTTVAHAAGNDRHVLFTITPPAARMPRVPRDVTLVIDVSGSMSGAKIRQARDAGVQLLRSLSATDRFRLIDFSSDARSFSRQFTSATEANVEAGVRYLRSLTAVGGTNIEAALLDALEPLSSGGRLPLVLFMTDGMPTVGETRAEVLAEMVAERRRDRRIFTFGVGADVNVALLEQLAIEGRGTAQFVRTEESIEHAVSVVASRLAEPLLTDVRVEVAGVRVRDFYPRLPADIFAGQDLVLLARYEGGGRADVLVSGRAAGRTVRFRSSVNFPANERRNDFVPRLWATRRIGHLMAERRRSPDTRELDQEIRSLALRYGLPSDQSSYLVVEPGMAPPPPVARGNTARTQGAQVLRAPTELRLEEVVVTAAPQATGRAAFESARQASGQMNATTIADAERTRSIAGRTFAQTDSGWVQISPAPPARGRTIRIKPYSGAYFEVMEILSELRAAFALGERVKVHGRGISIELADGGVEQLTDGLRRDLRRDW